MKTILAIHTGGTISMSQNEKGEVVPNAENPIAKEATIINGQVNLITDELFNLPSPHVTPSVMLQIKQRIDRAVTEGVDGVVITHGTDTLEETAYFLDLTQTSDIPIVLTGAMRSSNEIGSDGLYNFQSAIMVAATPESQGKGALVVMNDEIHTARYVTKTHTTNVATFRTPTFGPIGVVAKGKAQYFQELIQQGTCDIDHVDDNVFLIKAYAGMDGTLFNAIATPETKGLVIEGLGAGNLPPATLPAIEKLLALRIPIVLVSRCYNGVAQDIYDYEGGGIELTKMGLILCQGLNGQKARIKLLVGLSGGLTGDRLKAFVSNAIS
ncbi:L-asparaginase [Secundilactobacillus paracollinoides]|uniref:L-asparaginase n=1 Tax=Secundilactobacillus paracollinoides TaxID=240427 RepID=A0A1B2IYV9_9LACO|nr:asparaginase [Secundilactobacillus paracollinoides]ANZ61343.1 L-asparaginase [Secundilactobacillus paracollinoides]ANZ64266.1 L-asparaginase [Secundilactobacillus paracollinoides]ANZ67264.1 L-asparaginase [Secundilactobacillus paracollinoides]